MKSRQIGSLSVSEIGLGCNNFGMRLDASESAVVVHRALDGGITFFDTAESYGPSQEYLSKALGTRRKDVIVATKFGNRGTGAHRANIMRAVEDSLRALKTDHIDLYQQHRPDPNTPISETLEALEVLRQEGKIRECGCSNFSVQMLEAAEATTTEGPLTSAQRESGPRERRGGETAGFVSVQNEYSLFHREPETDGVLEFCEQHKLGLLPYFPLANGMLTGKYRKGVPKPAGTRISEMESFAKSHTPERIEAVERLIGFAGSRGKSLLELAFGYLLSRPEVSSVIAGATSVAQIDANAGAGGWRLSQEEMEEVRSLL